jgi:HAE1 family hydrophobic/amphiphilic exporter-1
MTSLSRQLRVELVQHVTVSRPVVAREQRARGVDLFEAAVDASRRRFRPILMTSFAFILGVMPLAVASGAGAASRRALGTAVIGGMLASTLLAVLFVPIFYVNMQRFSEWLAARKSPPTAGGKAGSPEQDSTE